MDEPGWADGADQAGHYVNKNVNWVGSRFYVFYIFMIVVGAYATHLTLVGSVLTTDQGWTLVNVVHGLVNFTVMHYVTGVPADLDKDEFYLLTWWEQLDDGLPWTPKKRNLTLIPVILFLWISHVTLYNLSYLFVNLAVLALVLVPKVWPTASSSLKPHA
eukprot:CAMPEP_0184510136 /NCGR_PEP_ID=MMETSP0198_2-20121128/1650_1 /TAXON_ID=1112570 /ORGANISM="Thraustochytrium sp., Strain LLF1b" /LENGTH=159 /DNA_ID=CAMNT_0026900001 /DNA_START=82 /DNA_END=557 /DNA_ORIENTATION=+